MPTIIHGKDCYAPVDLARAATTTRRLRWRNRPVDDGWATEWRDIARYTPLALPESEWGFPAYAWPGGYKMVYQTEDGGTLCANCAYANFDAADSQWNVISAWIIEGACVDHGVVRCDHCGTVMLEHDPEWEGDCSCYGE